MSDPPPLFFVKLLCIAFLALSVLPPPTLPFLPPLALPNSCLSSIDWKGSFYSMMPLFSSSSPMLEWFSSSWCVKLSLFSRSMILLCSDFNSDSMTEDCGFLVEVVFVCMLVSVVIYKRVSAVSWSPWADFYLSSSLLPLKVAYSDEILLLETLWWWGC